MTTTTTTIYRCPSCLSSALTRMDKNLQDLAGIGPLCLECGWDGEFSDLQTFDSEKNGDRPQIGDRRF